jgi:hypothetical protein
MGPRFESFALSNPRYRLAQYRRHGEPTQRGGLPQDFHDGGNFLANMASVDRSLKNRRDEFRDLSTNARI